MEEIRPEAEEADDAEAEVENLLQNVLHKSSLELMEYETELDEEAADVAPDLAKANKDRQAARADRDKLRTTVSGWTDGPRKQVNHSDLTADQQDLLNMVAVADSVSSPRHNAARDRADEKFARNFGK